MNLYQQKWIGLLNSAHLQGWKIEPQGDDIFIEMPHVTDIKLIRDNIPSTRWPPCRLISMNLKNG